MGRKDAGMDKHKAKSGGTAETTGDENKAQGCDSHNATTCSQLGWPPKVMRRPNCTIT